MNGNITVDADRDLVLVSNNTNLETTVLRDFPGDTGGIHGLMQGVHHRVDVGFFLLNDVRIEASTHQIVDQLGANVEIESRRHGGDAFDAHALQLPDHFFLLLHALGHGKQDGLPCGIDGLLVDVILVVHAISILYSLLSAMTRESISSPGTVRFYFTLGVQFYTLCIVRKKLLFLEQFEVYLILQELFHCLLGVADVVHVEQLNRRVRITTGQRQGDNSHAGKNSAYGIGHIAGTVKGEFLVIGTGLFGRVADGLNELGMAAGAQAQTHEQLAVQQDGALLEGNGQLLAEIDIGNIAAGDGIQEQAVLAGVLIGRGGNALDGGLFDDIEGSNNFAVDILGLEFLQGLDDNSAEGAAVSGAGADVIAIGANGLQGGNQGRSGRRHGCRGPRLPHGCQRRYQHSSG